MSVDAYVRIPAPLPLALERFAAWIGLPELDPPRRCRSRDAFDAACIGDQWRGIAVFAHEANGWTVFDDYTGYLGTLPAERWIGLAGDEELVFAAYNDAIPYGQLIVVRAGRVIREFLHDLQEPSNNVNHGRIEFERSRLFRRSTLIDDWVDAAYFVDSDELADLGANEGTLLLYRADGPAGEYLAARADED